MGVNELISTFPRFLRDDLRADIHAVICTQQVLSVYVSVFFARRSNETRIWSEIYAQMSEHFAFGSSSHVLEHY